jgi:hypothetical protein
MDSIEANLEASPLANSVVQYLVFLSLSDHAQAVEGDSPSMRLFNCYKRFGKNALVVASGNELFIMPDKNVDTKFRIPIQKRIMELRESGLVR